MRVTVALDAVNAALATVIDPEIRRPITDVGMVKGVDIDGGNVTVGVYLTIKSCPMQDTIADSVRTAVVGALPDPPEVATLLCAFPDAETAAATAAANSSTVMRINSSACDSCVDQTIETRFPGRGSSARMPSRRNHCRATPRCASPVSKFATTAVCA